MLDNLEMVHMAWLVYYAVSAGIIYLCYRLSSFMGQSSARLILLMLGSAILFTPWYYLRDEVQHIAPAVFIALYETVAVSLVAGLRSVLPIFAVFILLIVCLSFSKIVQKMSGQDES